MIRKSEKRYEVSRKEATLIKMIEARAMLPASFIVGNIRQIRTQLKYALKYIVPTTESATAMTLVRESYDRTRLVETVAKALATRDELQMKLSECRKTNGKEAA